jgi:hypothetical protein
MLAPMTVVAQPVSPSRGRRFGRFLARALSFLVVAILVCALSVGTLALAAAVSAPWRYLLVVGGSLLVLVVAVLVIAIIPEPRSEVRRWKSVVWRAAIAPPLAFTGLFWVLLPLLLIGIVLAAQAVSIAIVLVRTQEKGRRWRALPVLVIVTILFVVVADWGGFITLLSQTDISPN